MQWSWTSIGAIARHVNPVIRISSAIKLQDSLARYLDRGWSSGQGIREKMMEHAIVQARAFGKGSILLMMHRDNHRGPALYKMRFRRGWPWRRRRNCDDPFLIEEEKGRWIDAGLIDRYRTYKFAKAEKRIRTFYPVCFLKRRTRWDVLTLAGY